MILINNKEVNFTVFPNGETHIDSIQFYQLCKDPDNCNVSFKYESDSDLIKLMFVKRHLDTLNLDSNLIIYYMPYSRMDRTEGEKVFTLKYVAEFINSLKFKNVFVYQPHSDVTSALLNNCTAINSSIRLLEESIDMIGFDKDRDYIYYPDSSAEKHFSKSNNYKGLVGLKERDFSTGRITKLDVVGNLPKEKGFKVVMIDDLCSRGGTFMLGASKLKELGASEIYLVVTHCENNIFEGDIFKTDLIDKVFTTNSIIHENKANERLQILNLSKGEF